MLYLWLGLWRNSNANIQNEAFGWVLVYKNLLVFHSYYIISRRENSWTFHLIIIRKLSTIILYYYCFERIGWECSNIYQIIIVIMIMIFVWLSCDNMPEAMKITYTSWKLLSILCYKIYLKVSNRLRWH